MKTILKIPYYSLVIGVALVGLFLLATTVRVPGNMEVKIVKSGSMMPTIQTGGIVVIRPSHRYAQGDVITFGRDTKTEIPTTHRIIGEESGAFVTKGDANDAPDPALVKQSDIKGKVIFSAPYVGYILDFARKPLGFVLLVGIPALIVIIDEIISIINEIKKIRGRKTGTNSRMSMPSNRGSDTTQHYTQNRSINMRGNVLDLRPRMPVSRNFGQSAAYSPSFFRNILLFFVTLFPMAWFAINLGNLGSTASYYREKEVSSGNSLRASTDFGINSLSFLLDSPTSSTETFDRESAALPLLESLAGEDESAKEDITQEEIVEEIVDEILETEEDSVGDTEDTQEELPVDTEETTEEPEGE